MFGKFCLRVFVGLAVFIALGGRDAFQILVLLVICTWGLGLLVVIPGAYLIGLLCTIWFVPFGKEKNGKATSIRQPEKVGYVNMALRDYIRAAEAKGRDWESIRDELAGLGWDEQAITIARGSPGASRPVDS